MKLQFSHSNIDVGEVGEEEEAGFDIRQFEKMQTLVTKNLVADKELYCIQEVISNAVDSYVDSGRDTITHPIEVSFENGVFVVKDYGKGISVENMRKVVMPLFASDKSKDNNAIGCFGLGFRSPLGISSAFTCESVHDGIRRVWTIFEKGMSVKYSLDWEEPTLDCNGTKITIPFNNQYGVLSKIMAVCKYQKGVWIAGEEIFNNTPLIEGKTFFYRPGYTNAGELTLGTIPYKSGRNNQVALRFDVGELNPNISREAVELNTESTQLIKDREEAALAELASYLKYENDYDLLMMAITKDGVFDFGGKEYKIDIPNTFWDKVKLEESFREMLKANPAHRMYRMFSSEYKGLTKKSRDFTSHYEFDRFIVKDFPVGKMWTFLKQKYNDISLYKLISPEKLDDSDKVIWNILNTKVTDFSDLQEEFKTWDTKNKKVAKENRNFRKSNTSFDNSLVTFKYLRQHAYNTDCVVDTIYLSSVNKRKNLIVYSEDVEELKKLWELDRHSYILMIMNKKGKENIDLLHKDKYVEAKDLFSGKIRRANRQVESFIILNSFQKNKVICSFNNLSYYKTIHPPLYKVLSSFKKHIDKYDLSMSHISFLDAIAQDHIKRGLISEELLKNIEYCTSEIKKFKVDDDVLTNYRIDKSKMVNSLRQITLLNAENKRLKNQLNALNICKNNK